MPFTPETKAILQEKLLKKHVSNRSQAGQSLSYIESHHAIREANRAFGFDGWNRETLSLTVVQAEQIDSKWRVSYTAQSKITVGEVVRFGTGFGQGIDKDLGKAHESAIKEAESDAMKRALMTFGDIFGLALYDKTQANVTSVVEVEQPEQSSAPSGPTQEEVKAFVESLKMTKEESKKIHDLMKSKKLKPTVATLMAQEEGVSNFDEFENFLNSLEVAA